MKRDLFEADHEIFRASVREEALPVHGIKLRWTGPAPKRFHVEPGLIGGRDTQ